MNSTAGPSLSQALEALAAAWDELDAEVGSPPSPEGERKLDELLEILQADCWTVETTCRGLMSELSHLDVVITNARNPDDPDLDTIREGAEEVIELRPKLPGLYVAGPTP